MDLPDLQGPIPEAPHRRAAGWVRSVRWLPSAALLPRVRPFAARLGLALAHFPFQGIFVPCACMVIITWETSPQLDLARSDQACDTTVVFGVNTHSVPTVDQFLRVEWTASIPTVDIESGSARYSAWRALRAACCLPAASACTSYGTGTSTCRSYQLSCTSSA